MKKGLLLPYQQRWCYDTSQVSVCVKSRQIGISWAQAAASALWAARGKRPGSTYYLAYNHEMTKQFVADAATFASGYDKAAKEVEEVVIHDEEGDIAAYRVVFATGKEVVGMPSEPRVLRSRRGHIVIDEAAFVNDLEALMEAALAMLIWGWTVRIISTHFGADNEFATLVDEVRSGKLPYSLHEIDFARAVGEGLYRKTLQVQGRAMEWSPESEAAWVESIRAQYGERASQELDCIPSAGSGRYFPRALVERAMKPKAPVVRYQQTDEFTYRSEKKRKKVTSKWIAEHLEPVLAAAREAANGAERQRGYLGMDIARSGDLSVISATVETARLDIETVVQIEMRNVPFSEQQRILHYTIDGMPRFSGAAIDSRGNGQMLAEQAAQKYGPAYVHEVMLTRATYAEYFPRYKQRLEDETYALPKDSGVMDDHRVIALDKGVPIVAEKTGPAEEQRHGDSAIAHMLVCYAQANDDGTYQPYAHHPVKIAGAGRWMGRGSDDEEDEDW